MKSPRSNTQHVRIIAQALRDPFPALKRGEVVYVPEFDAALTRAHQSTRDEVEVRRARDWSLLANQEVGLEDLTVVRHA